MRKSPKSLGIAALSLILAAPLLADDVPAPAPAASPGFALDDIAIKPAKLTLEKPLPDKHAWAARFLAKPSADSKPAPSH
jgi:hypothetical protein